MMAGSRLALHSSIRPYVCVVWPIDGDARLRLPPRFQSTSSLHRYPPYHGHVNGDTYSFPCGYIRPKSIKYLALPQLFGSSLRLLLLARETLSHEVNTPEELGVLVQLLAPPRQSRAATDHVGVKWSGVLGRLCFVVFVMSARRGRGRSARGHARHSGTPRSNVRRS